MRPTRTITAIVAVAAALVAVAGAAAWADGGSRPPAPQVVRLDDGLKERWTGHASLAVSGGSDTEAVVGQAIPTGKRLVVETLSVIGGGGGPVTQDQGIERVTVAAGPWQIAVPLDRYSWGSCPGFEPPEACSAYSRYWQYGGTQTVRAYVDAGEQVVVSAWHPGDGTQQIEVDVLGYLVTR